MRVKVFVLGRPGSGKSTAARQMKHLFRQNGCLARHINDYEILREMFLEDIQHLKFQPTEHNGFDAIDLTVMDIALQKVQEKVQECLSSVDVVTIEFARNDYREALQQFDPTFLKDAYFLFLDADIETCLRRVHERVERSTSGDDHPSFSDDLFRSYYDKENREYMIHRLQKEFDICKQVKVINNTGPFEDFVTHVEQFANTILEQEIRVLEPAILLKE